jgi:hypothetical protein
MLSVFLEFGTTSSVLDTRDQQRTVLAHGIKQQLQFIRNILFYISLSVFARALE